ncbi:MULTISPECIES: YbaK/EbsC family protein [Desulfosporosinus]|uniref:YbaK/EbsC family protein n=1 Tax=Desulfosporosinus nitroreducens TaxID=2018668 RepID=A0ABT8QUK1_9FIRM|nr:MULTISPECIES: YbaK/EbsC family protein [Desulfosporosinus]MCO1602199.1 YbaK/EbsC family protein [Desulfosporosinus nitroreducens]MCO5385017.1 YbaK/EbsC family protein [Desulfosporosinus sp.]MDA8222378.1 YbaK/EbsC family protein [Desulfitobacterium hafniense]MDO0825042.1 YbaK/EbsC family protein [Desulfosporosinus nitroreducens]
MSVESVAAFLEQNKKDIKILKFQDTSTVAKAADALGVTPGEIAKSLLFKVKDDFIMILMAGDKRLDNRKFKEIFHTKAKMPEAEEVSEATGHPVGGVCPFGLKHPIPIYLDHSLKSYTQVFPAAGASNTAIKLTVEELEELTKAQWVDVIQS